MDDFVPTPHYDEFRAWDKVNKKMKDVAAIHWYDGELDHTIADAGVGWYSPSDSSKLKDVILMHNTRIKDRDGLEIFEGDIVKRVYSKNDQLVGVVFRLENGMWVIGGHRYVLASAVEKTKVIGNVYEDMDIVNGRGAIRPLSGSYGWLLPQLTQT